MSEEEIKRLVKETCREMLRKVADRIANITDDAGVQIANAIYDAVLDDMTGKK